MPVIGCDSQGKKMVAEAGYICNIAEQHRYFTTPRSKRKRGSPYPSIGYLVPLAVRMVALASR